MTVPAAITTASTAKCFSCFPALVRRGNGGVNNNSGNMKGLCRTGDGFLEQSPRAFNWAPECGPSLLMLKAIARAKACPSPGSCDGSSCCCIRDDVSVGMASTVASTSSPVVGYYQSGHRA